jgi:hypothetical protein
MVSEAATVEEGEIGDNTMVIADASRAFFEAKATRDVCVELVDEDKTEDDRKQDRVGWLRLSMYGTRDGGGENRERVWDVHGGGGMGRG